MLKIFANNKGFTLIEIAVVMMIMAIVLVLAVPRLFIIFGDKNDQFKFLITYITKTYDNAFLNDRTNFLVIHLAEPDAENIHENDIFNRTNGVSVVNLKDKKFIEISSRILKTKKFVTSFRIEEVLFPHKEKIVKGYAMIPFYQHGYSENAIIHILVNNEHRMSVRIFKHQKEPLVSKDFMIFEEDNK